jgi:probable HAF family extracellular repeat protein
MPLVYQGSAAKLSPRDTQLQVSHHPATRLRLRNGFACPKDVHMKAIISPSLLCAALLTGLAYGADTAASGQSLQVRYKLDLLPALGGSTTAANGINDLGWIVGQSSLADEATSHAALWRRGAVTDLGTLGGPNSAVLWPVKNVRGIVTGIAQTDEADTSGEIWSCGYFFPEATATGKRCMGFRWQDGTLTRLPPFSGGTHSFATGTNNWGQTVGWAENGVHDPSCNAPQILQFRAVVWGPGKQMRELPPLPDDSTSAATAINDRGQVVGISGACSNAVGGLSARRNVLWDNGKPVDIGDFGGIAWNTPMAINQRGDVVGFANASADAGTSFRPNAFLWIKGQGIQRLTLLPGHTRGQALGINEWRQIVGQSCDSAGDDCRAVLWHDGVPTDLNTLVSPSGTATLTSANDIDDLGRIAGTADDAGKTVAFKATPILTGR